MELESGIHNIQNLRFFLSGVLGLENSSALVDEKPEDIFTRSFQSKKYNAVKFFLTDLLDPTYPLDDENLETR